MSAGENAGHADTPCDLTPLPNPEEAARWSKIAGFLEVIRRRNGNAPLRTVEIGCGRGWLTNLISRYYGSCEGIDPSAEMTAGARILFPSLRFTVGTATTLREEASFKPYDVVIASQSIEHIEPSERDAFIHSLRALLKPGGYIVLTAWRCEINDQWEQIVPAREGWETEQHMQARLEAEGLQCMGQERIYVEVPTRRVMPAPTPDEYRTLNLLPLYQIWACRWPGELSPASVPRFSPSPMVSVIVPTYNRPHWLREALQSILTQTFQDFEIIVVDDGKIDVAPVIETLAHGGRITYVRHDYNRGLAASRNTGLRLAKGTYIAYLDDDDRYYPNHLAVLVRALQETCAKAAYSDAFRAVEICAGQRRKVIERDLPYSCDFDVSGLFVSNYLPVLCMMHERTCLDEVGVFDETLYAHEDWDLWIRMAMKFPFLHVKQTTAEFSWRTDGSSMTSSTRESYLRTTEIIYRKYRPHAEQIPGIIEAQQHELTIRQRALIQHSSNAATAEQMYRGHHKNSTHYIFREFLTDRRPRTLVMGLCSALGMSYGQFCRLIFWLSSFRQTLASRQRNRQTHQSTVPTRRARK